MTPDEIKKGLNTSILGKNIIFYPEITSTNDIAIELAINGAEEGTIIIADNQTIGRGRRGRKWFSPPKTCILASIILRPKIDLSQINIITTIAITSVTKAIQSLTKLTVFVKWPNDIIINDKKVSGVLTETRIERNALKFAVVGIGVNVNIPQYDIPAEISDIASSLNIELGHEISRTELLQEILRYFEDSYLKITDNYDDILKEWRSFSANIGKKIQIESSEGVMTGIALDIDKLGNLIVHLDKGKIIKISNDDNVKIRNV